MPEPSPTTDVLATQKFGILCHETLSRQVIPGGFLRCLHDPWNPGICFVATALRVSVDPLGNDDLNIPSNGRY